MPDWSPEKPCPACGVGVQTYSGYRVRRPTTFLAGTWMPHRHDAPELGVLRECPDCEAMAVYERDGEFWDWRAAFLPESQWRKHECPKAEAPKAVVAPVKVEMAETGPRSATPPTVNYDRY